MTNDSETSPVREAVERVLSDWRESTQSYPHVDAFGQDFDGMVGDVVRAVEALPRATIRDLDMTVDENIATVRNPVDLVYLRKLMEEAERAGVLNLAVDAGFLKLKPGDYGAWSAPVATMVYVPA